MTLSDAPGVLVVDNQDSFVHTLAGYLVDLGACVTVSAAASIDPDEVGEEIARHAAVVVSPGPGRPESAPVALALVRAAMRTRTPLLGVCLGHQAIAVALGGAVVRAREQCHGVTSPIEHDGQGLFRGLPPGFPAARYHSLVVHEAALPATLRVTARTADGTVMAIEHESVPLVGVQFHPESILTEGGYLLLANWLRLTGSVDAIERAVGLSPRSGTVTAPSSR